jgi:hypothetical protein
VAGNTSFLTGGFSGDGGAATNASLNDPDGVAVDGAGNVFIADYNNQRIRKVDTNGIINTIIGGGTSYADDLPGTNTELIRPTGVILDNNNDVFVSTFRISEMSTNNIATTVAGWADQGSLADYVPATNANLSGLSGGMAFDAVGNLYLAAINRVRKVHFGGDPTLLLLDATTNNTGNYSVVVTSPYGTITSSNVTLIVFNMLAIGTTSANADGSFTLNLSGTPNVSSRLYVTTNLTPPVTWLPLATNVNGGAWQFTDTNAVNRPVQFYRLSTP